MPGSAVHGSKAADKCNSSHSVKPQLANNQSQLIIPSSGSATIDTILEKAIEDRTLTPCQASRIISKRAQAIAAATLRNRQPASSDQCMSDRAANKLKQVQRAVDEGIITPFQAQAIKDEQTQALEARRQSRVAAAAAEAGNTVQRHPPPLPPPPPLTSQQKARIEANKAAATERRRVRLNRERWQLSQLVPGSPPSSSPSPFTLPGSPLPPTAAAEVSTESEAPKAPLIAPRGGGSEFLKKRRKGRSYATVAQAWKATDPSTHPDSIL